MPARSDSPSLELQHSGPDRLTITLGGSWVARSGLPRPEVVERELERDPRPNTVEFVAHDLSEWDSGLLSFLLHCTELCQRHKIAVKSDRMPDGIRKLIELAQAVPEATEARREKPLLPLLGRLGESALRVHSGAREALTFLGEVVIASFKLLRGRAQFRWSDAWLEMQKCGPQALAVVALINFLVGLILAFIGAVLLLRFGASIYVADLVAIATVREMGCLMTGIILCGRTGAAFAAQLGTMKGNEEIDAFQTFGISPIEFLVLPRVLGLVLMMPLLCVFANAIAMTGAFIVSVSMLDMGPAEYLDRTIQAVDLKSFFLGIFKGVTFGVLVAITGCLRGLQCGPSAAAVGQATTSAVVTGITSIVAADGIFAVICDALEI